MLMDDHIPATLQRIKRRTYVCTDDGWMDGWMTTSQKAAKLISMRICASYEVDHSGDGFVTSQFHESNPMPQWFTGQYTFNITDSNLKTFPTPQTTMNFLA